MTYHFSFSTFFLCTKNTTIFYAIQICSKIEHAYGLRKPFKILVENFILIPNEERKVETCCHSYEELPYAIHEFDITSR
jgi:hypothetical protein